MNDEKGTRGPTLVGLENDEKGQRKSIWSRLDERGTDLLWSFVERDAGTWRFWVKVTVTMFIMNTALLAAIYLFFLGRDLGYFEESRQAAEYYRLDDQTNTQLEDAVFSE